ncbi:MAG TPA: Glu/Leu/Phe/Val dehydrogenase dimerization domain-containing protein [Methylomirabilota bacterium]|nr:Glu/Leu/Phe/Val dehydrogenase dimerization domain-containing protein [Methylomirabilota bacterium]
MPFVARGIGDELGPDKVVLLREPRVGLEAVVVIDNVACGPAIGGVRMAPDVTVEEVSRLARAMTLKNAAAGLAHGGGKSGIAADPAAPPADKERLIRAFARAIRSLTEYIPGPDMGTDERCMAWIKDEVDRAVGLPRVLGGIPLDEIGATGWGVAIAAEIAAPEAGIALAGARVAIEGFGAVGQHAARFLAARGCRMVAASDSRGAIHDPAGLPIDALIAHKRAGRPLTDFPGGRMIGRDALIGVPCEIWIPAARPDTITADNVSGLQAKLVIQGANIPATEPAERWMHAHRILSVPDFIANAGGVICAAIEYHGGSQVQAFATIEERIRANTRETLDGVRTDGIVPREAATRMALARVREAMRYRRP